MAKIDEKYEKAAVYIKFWISPSIKLFIKNDYSN